MSPHWHSLLRFAVTPMARPAGWPRGGTGGEAMGIKPSVIVIAAAVLTGCAAQSTSTGSAPAAAGSPSAQSTADLCTTRACIADDMDQELPGIVAKDEAVISKAVCKASTVKINAGVWTATCTVTESDGSVSVGYGNIVLSSRQVTYDPQKILKMPGS